MAGPVRQQFDIPSLERYIEKNVPAISTPITLKQVFTSTGNCNDFANDIQVWLWTVKPHIPGMLPP